MASLRGAGGRDRSRGAWQVIEYVDTWQKKKEDVENKKGGGVAEGLDRWKREMVWLEEFLREWLLKERNERQEKMEWIGEEEDGRHVEVEVEEIGRQMERRREKPREEGSERKEKREEKEIEVEADAGGNKVEACAGGGGQGEGGECKIEKGERKQG